MDRTDIIERKVRRARLEFRGGRVQLIIPRGKKYLAPVLLTRFSGWIARRLAEHEQLLDAAQTMPFENRREIEFYDLIQKLMAEEGSRLNVQPRSISFRMMKRRWGSCSIAGDILLNRKLKNIPDYLVRYVVYHELCHMRIHAHNREFKSLVKKEFSDHRVLDQQLKIYNQIFAKQL